MAISVVRLNRVGTARSIHGVTLSLATKSQFAEGADDATVIPLHDANLVARQSCLISMAASGLPNSECRPDASGAPKRTSIGGLFGRHSERCVAPVLVSRS